jgi:hypothetical protein
VGAGRRRIDFDMARRVAPRAALALGDGLLAFLQFPNQSLETHIAGLESERHLEILNGAREVAGFDIRLGLAVKLAPLRSGAPGLGASPFHVRIFGFRDLDPEVAALASLRVIRLAASSIT